MLKRILGLRYNAHLNRVPIKYLVMNIFDYFELRDNLQYKMLIKYGGDCGMIFGLLIIVSLNPDWVMSIEGEGYERKINQLPKTSILCS